jgi:hypothetical protein
MSAIVVGNQRVTVKDMVLADYQIPKGVSTLHKKNKFWHMMPCGLVVTSQRAKIPVLTAIRPSNFMYRILIAMRRHTSFIS